MDKYVVVFGSCGWDSTFKQNADFSFPLKPTLEAPGGKGANQAVSAARAGFNVKMITIVGDDKKGLKIKENLENNNIDISCIKTIPNIKSDSCNIFVGVDGSNDIKREKDATLKFDVDMIEEFDEIIKKSECVITQSKMNKKVYSALIDFCYENNVKTVLTPCPANELSIFDDSDLKLLEKVSFITANEDEAKEITNSNNPISACNKLHNLIVTCGDQGVYFYNNGTVEHIDAIKPNIIVDTTGAGDTFCGNFISSYLNGIDKRDAIEIGIKAATIKIQHMGAQAGMPYKEEIK